MRPVDRDVLIELIAKILIEKSWRPEAGWLLCVGAKGSVGTSIVAQTSALAFSRDLEQKLVIMDAAGGGSCQVSRWERKPLRHCMKHRVYQDLVIRIISPDDC